MITYPAHLDDTQKPKQAAYLIEDAKQEAIEHYKATHSDTEQLIFKATKHRG